MHLLPKTIAVAAAVCMAGTVQADIVTFTGTTTGAPTFNRPLEDLTGLSGVGTAVAYDRYFFSVGTSGDYTFLTTGTFDTFALLYTPTFSSAASLTNAVVANDDLLGFTTSGFTATLTAGASYVLVNTGFANADFGAFSTTIGGPGTITAVPEPAAWALLIGGLGVVGWARRRKPGTQSA